MAICQTGGEHNRAVLFGKVALSHGLGMKLGGVFSETLIDNFGCVINIISSGHSNYYTENCTACFLA